MLLSSLQGMGQFPEQQTDDGPLNSNSNGLKRNSTTKPEVL